MTCHDFDVILISNLITPHVRYLDINNGWSIENRYQSHALIFFIKEETVLNNAFLEFNFQNR